MNTALLSVRASSRRRLQRLLAGARIVRSAMLLTAVLMPPACCVVVISDLRFSWLFARCEPRQGCGLSNEGAVCWGVFVFCFVGAFVLNAAVLLVERLLPRDDEPSSPYRTAATLSQSPR